MTVEEMLNSPKTPPCEHVKSYVAHGMSIRCVSCGSHTGRFSSNPLEMAAKWEKLADEMEDGDEPNSDVAETLRWCAEQLRAEVK